MGFPEQELVVTGTVKEVDGDRVVIDTVAAQGENQVIRNAEAEVHVASNAPRIPIIRDSVLSERQNQILSLVVERYVDDGRPVGSRALANRADIDWSSSTVRAELASLEEEGFLTHPHTSAGRVPTDSGYRFYVERLLAQQDRLPRPVLDELGISRMRREVDVAIRETTTTLSQVTDLVALVTAPPLHTATIHRIEVLRLQPRGGDGRGDRLERRRHQAGLHLRVRRSTPGLVEWAASYLNERLAGLGLGARMAVDRLRDPELGRQEQGFLAGDLERFHRPR